MKFIFSVEKTTHGARAGKIIFANGEKIPTPVFMPVGTQASVKGLSQNDLSEIGYGLILANTYHLYLRPGLQVLRRFGGLHDFMSWPGRILTDSGGFQALSLSKLTKHTEEGIFFRSHLDGSSHWFDPFKVVDIQKVIGSDIVMPLDDCAPYPSSQERLKVSLKRTHGWFEKSHRYFYESMCNEKQTLFAIIQGGANLDMRKMSTEKLREYKPDGYAIGGLSVGEKGNEFREALRVSTENIPEEKPRYLMGVGSVPEIINAVQLGVDMFDCVLPTRNARNGQLFTTKGKLNIRNLQYADDASPIDEGCGCRVCLQYSRGYLRHLHKSNELLASSLSSFHNLAFMHTFMRKIREEIMDGQFSKNWEASTTNKLKFFFSHSKPMDDGKHTR